MGGTLKGGITMLSTQAVLELGPGLLRKSIITWAAQAELLTVLCPTPGMSTMCAFERPRAATLASRGAVIRSKVPLSSSTGTALFVIS